MKKLLPYFFILIFFSTNLFCHHLSAVTTEQNKTPYNLTAAYTYNINKIKNLKIETTFETLEIKEVFGDELYIEIYGNNNLLFPKISETENSVDITSTMKKTTHGDICNIILYIPSGADFDTIEINTKSKNKNKLSFSNLKSDKLILNTLNSDIICKFITGNIQIRSVNGNIDINGISTKKSSFFTKNGQILLKNAKFGQISSISDSNIIDFNNIEGEYLLLENNTGTINCDNISVDYFDIKNDSGQTSLSIKQTPTGSSFIKSNTGFIQLFIPISHDFSLNVHSTKGTFFNKLDKTRNTPRHDFIKDYNNGGAEIFIKTFSGDIEVDRY